MENKTVIDLIDEVEAPQKRPLTTDERIIILEKKVKGLRSLVLFCLIILIILVIILIYFILNINEKGLIQ